MSSKLREALSKASIALSWASHGHLTEDDAKEYLAVVDAALAEPLKNCEVGTAEKQFQRFELMCNANCEDCKSCPFSDEDGYFEIEECALKWAQMPYKSEVK